MDQETAGRALAAAVTGLQTRAGTTLLPRAYYKGDHRTRLHSDNFTNPNRAVIENIRDNQCRKIVEVVIDRLTPTGFTPTDPAGELAAARAWDLWQTSRMDLRLDQWLRGSEITGQPATIIVDVDEAGQVQFYPQQPETVWVHTSPTNPTRALWAVQLWTDDDGYRRATIRTAGPEHFVYRGPKADQDAGTAERYVLTETVPNPVPGVCPVFTATIGYTDLTDAIPLQDMLNAELQREAVAGEFYSLITRVYLGYELEEDPETGQPKAPFGIGDRQIFLPDTGTDVKDLPGQNPAPFLEAASAHRQAIASASSTPAYLLTSGGQEYPSGAARRTAEAGFIAKVKNRRAVYGAALADAAAYAVALDALTTAGTLIPLPELAVMWEPADVSEQPTPPTVTELAAMGVPLALLLTRYLGWTQEAADEAQAAADMAAAERAAAASAYGMPPVV